MNQGQGSQGFRGRSKCAHNTTKARHRSKCHRNAETDAVNSHGKEFGSVFAPTTNARKLSKRKRKKMKAKKEKVYQQKSNQQRKVFARGPKPKK